MHVLDPPGFQNPASVGKQDGAVFEDLCHNYEHERLQKFFHDTVFGAQMERYSQVLYLNPLSHIIHCCGKTSRKAERKLSQYVRLILNLKVYRKQLFRQSRGPSNI